MAFVKRDVKDRVVQYPRRYQMVEVQPGIFDLIPVTGTITEPGTAINKAYLQPIEDGLANALEKTGDGKDVTVTFAEAATEAHIASGEKLSVMFGKILKKFKSIVPVALGGTGASTAATARTNLGVPPISHAITGTTYGVGTTTYYGHVKTINDLTKSSYVSGEALAAYQGKVLKEAIGSINNISSGQVTYSENIAANSKVTKYIPIGANKKHGRAILRNTANGMILFNTDRLESYGITPATLYTRRTDEYLMSSETHTGSIYIRPTEFYISGSNIVVEFTNSNASERPLNCSVNWEVW